MTEDEMEKLRRAADTVRKRVSDKTVNVPVDSGVRGQMLRQAAAKAKKRRMNELGWRGLDRVRDKRNRERATSKDRQKVNPTPRSPNHDPLAQ